MLNTTDHSVLLQEAECCWVQGTVTSQAGQTGGGNSRVGPRDALGPKWEVAMDGLCLFPGQGGAFRRCQRLWKAWQCPLSPLGSPLSWRRTGQGPGHPHPSPEHSLHLMCVEPRRPLVGCRRECRLQGPRAARLPPEGAWRLLVAGHPDGHGAGWEQLPLSPRRGWWARTGRGPAPSAGKPRPSAEPTLGPRLGSQQVGWGAPPWWARWWCGGAGVRAGWRPTPGLALAARRALRHGDWGPQRGQVLAHQLPAEAAPQERYFCSWGAQALVLVLG